MKPGIPRRKLCGMGTALSATAWILRREWDGKFAPAKLFSRLLEHAIECFWICGLPSSSVARAANQSEELSALDRRKMKIHCLSHVSLLLLLLSTMAFPRLAQNGFKNITGKPLENAVPRDFYLEGNAIPVERDQAVLIETPAGTRSLFALIVTAGFASRIQHKYSGMLISEGNLSVCGKKVRIGSYGFGLRRTGVKESLEASFSLYNQAGDRIAECDMKKDLQLREPKPLQVMIQSPRSARLYLGRYWLRLGP